MSKLGDLISKLLDAHGRAMEAQDMPTHLFYNTRFCEIVSKINKLEEELRDGKTG